MSEKRAPENTEVGVVGDHPEVAAAIERAGGTPILAAPSDLASRNPEAIVAVDESSVLTLARSGVESPVLPLDAGRAIRSVHRDDVDAAITNLVAGEVEVITYPIIAVMPMDIRILMDLLIVSEAPAQISEFTVVVDDHRVATVRADGVAVSTPAGSYGYTRDVGGPVMTPGTGVVAVVPVAPFETDPDHWVLPLEKVGLTVARDEIAVELLADDRSAGTVAPGESIHLRRDGSFAVAVVPESPPFAAPG